MSIVETNKIDAIGISKDGKGLMLMLADHLNWNNEKEHLILLQDKINAYLGFIESGQYADNYPNINFEYFIIDIRYKYGVTSNCLKFFKAVNNQLKEDNIHLCHKED